ncbi:hypothetical protein U1Q18_029604 [Sarracenia purpurea var. burkii]
MTCTQISPEKRPTMRHVYDALERLAASRQSYGEVLGSFRLWKHVNSQRCACVDLFENHYSTGEIQNIRFEAIFGVYPVWRIVNHQRKSRVRILNSLGIGTLGNYRV